MVSFIQAYLLHEFSIERVVFACFSTFILVDVIYLGGVYKRLFKVKMSKIVKPFDCYPCMGFWCGLATLDITTALLTFVIFRFYEAIRFN